MASILKQGILRKRADNLPSWRMRYFTLFSDFRLTYSREAQGSSQIHGCYDVRSAHLLQHTHSNGVISFSLMNLKDSKSNLTCIQFSADSNNETQSWITALQSLIPVMTPKVDSFITAASSSASHSESSLRWATLDSYLATRSSKTGPVKSVLDIKLDKVLPPDCQLTATSIATAWDFFERPLSDLFDQANNLAGWTLQSLDNGVRLFRHDTIPHRSKATVIVEAPPAFVLHMLMDNEYRQQWDHLTSDLKYSLQPCLLNLFVSSIEKIDSQTDVCFSTMRSFLSSSSSTASSSSSALGPLSSILNQLYSPFWAPREYLTLRHWSRNAIVSTALSTANIYDESNAKKPALVSRLKPASAAASAISSVEVPACVLIEVGVSHRDKEVRKGTTRLDVNMMGYLMRSVNGNPNRTLITLIADANVGGWAKSLGCSMSSRLLPFASSLQAANDSLHASFASRLAGLRDAIQQVPNIENSIAPPKDDSSKVARK